MNFIWNYYGTALLLWCLANVAQSVLDVDCHYDTLNKKMTCECVSSFTSTTTSWEDLSDVVQDFISDRLVALSINHIMLRNCRSLNIEVDFSTLSSLSDYSNRISIVSFENIENLRLYIDNIDQGAKTIVADDVDYLVLSGRMYEKTSSLRFFLRNEGFGRRGTVLFDDFFATTPISLINIQYAESVRVSNSAFYDLREIELRNVDQCYLGENTYSTSVRCTKEDLFVSTTSPGISVRNAILIAGICLLVLAIVVGIVIVLYVRHWRKKNDLELLGYPSRTPSRSTVPGSNF